MGVVAWVGGRCGDVTPSRPNKLLRLLRNVLNALAINEQEHARDHEDEGDTDPEVEVFSCHG
jgi:hypothetical protein